MFGEVSVSLEASVKYGPDYGLREFLGQFCTRMVSLLRNTYVRSKLAFQVFPQVVLELVSWMILE